MTTKQDQIDYQATALHFLNDTNTSFKARFKSYDYYFPEDTQARSIFRITLRNALGSYTFSFGQSIANGNEEPTPYDVLICLQKYDVGSYEDFCSEFGYEAYNEYFTGKNKIANRIYKAVVKEFEAIERLFTEEQLEQLRDIQ